MTKRQKKISMIIILLAGAACVIGLILYALRQNIDLYYTPTQILAGEVSPETHCRMGGMVVKGSVHHEACQNDPSAPCVSFALTDMKNKTMVYYQGILPDLFREGQGIVAEGHLDAHQHFIADEVLAKHDEKYMPPVINQKKDK